MRDPLVGQTLGEYQLEERIGHGAMAVVYRAYQPAVQRQVALKVIKLDLDLDEAQFRRFSQEAELIAGLEHIHILPLFDYGIDQDLAYIAMRLLSGGTLADLLAKGPIPLDRAADIITQIARGLSHAHRRGIIHRDLKPTNILFDNVGNAYLTDFGLAKVLATPDMTKPGNLVGTPAYVSPEALRGEPLDHRSDLYSFGILTYEILTGRTPFDLSNGNILALIRAHLEQDPPKPRQFNPSIPTEVEAVILKALQKNPADRFPDAEAMADALNTALGRRYSTGSHPALRPVTPRGEQKPIRTQSRPSRRWRRPLLTLLLLGMVAIGVWIAVRASSLGGSPQTATIVPGAVGSPDDAVPSPQELDRARAILGPSGFIAYIACGMESEFQVIRARELSDFATAVDITLRVYDSETDGYIQLTQIERARLEDARALLICPLDSSLLEPALESLRVAHIPVVLMAEFDSSFGYGVMLNTNDYATGWAAGKYAGELLVTERGGRGNVVLLGYDDLPTTRQRTQGMRDGLLEAAPNITLTEPDRGLTREYGQQTVQLLVTQGVELDAIVTLNDAIAFGAIDALEEAGIPPSNVIMTSVNAEALAVEYIQEGRYLRGSVRANREVGSRTALNAAIRLLAGAIVPETFLLPAGEIVTRDSGSPS